VVINRIMHYHKATGVCLDDLIQHAYMLAEKADRTFDPTKAKFSTWLWRNLTHGLFWFCRKSLNSGANFDPGLLANHHVEFCPARACEWKDQIENLSEEAREAIRIVLEEPQKLRIKGHEPAKTIRGRLWRYLGKEMGLTEKDVWKVGREIKEMLQ